MEIIICFLKITETHIHVASFDRIRKNSFIELKTPLLALLTYASARTGTQDPRSKTFVKYIT